MKQTIIAILIMAITFYAKAQTQWEAIKIKNISASFPGKPVETPRGEGSAVTNYTLKTADSTTGYRVNLIEFEIAGLDSNQIAEGVEQDEFWESLEKQVFQSFEGALNLKKEKTTFLGKIAMKYEFEVANEDKQPNSINTLVSFFLGSDFYIIQFTNSMGKADIKNRDLFFSSIKINQ